jgi:hypothetical protein
MGRHRPIQRTKRIKAAAIPKGTSREYEGDRDGSTRSPRAGSPPAPGWNTATNLIIRDGQRKAFQNGLAEQIKRQIAKLYQCVMWLGAGALGREDSNLRMAESKSDRFRCKINVHSEKLREFAPRSVNRLTSGKIASDKAIRAAECRAKPRAVQWYVDKARYHADTKSIPIDVCLPVSSTTPRDSERPRAFSNKNW